MPQQHTATDQVKFLSQWFMSWSEMQREDFLPVLMQAYQPKDHLNGLVGGYESLGTRGRRPSLFDCQMKLFHDWFGTWTESDRQSLLEHLRELDPEFMRQYEKRLSGEASQEDISTSQQECGGGGGDESHNPPSSLSSPPSTLPRSHSPHDSGLDEPSTDTEHTELEPQGLDRSHDKDDVTVPTAGDAPSPPPKAAANVTTITITGSDVQGEEVFNMDELANGLTAESQSKAAEAELEETAISQQDGEAVVVVVAEP